MNLLVDTREDAEERRFSRAIQSNDADLRAVKVREIDIFEDRLLVVKLADADHRVDDFIWFRAHNTLFCHKEAQNTQNDFCAFLWLNL
jgi:hypothetical protein